MADQSNIQSAASKSIRPFRSSEEYLYAMKEDLAEWLNTLYDLDVQVDNFMDVLETGFDLCQHANNVNRIAMEFLQSRPEAAAAAAASSSMRIPRKEVVFQSKNVVPGSFVARDNVSNFIQWCRQELGIQDVLMFETNDLVLKKNEKNFVLCLLEVARKGSKFGMLAPILIQMEEEIEEEMRDQGAGYGGGGAFEEAAEAEAEAVKAGRDLGPQSPVYPNRTQRMTLCDLKNLDELVREILGHCTCPSQFPMVKVSEGKYKVGDSNALIFVRVLRSHVMVRVGGGWDTLEHYLDKHDPCRCTSFSHRLTQTRGLGFSPQKTSAPGSQPSSPNTQRRSEASGHPRVGEKRLSAGGEAGHPKGPRPGYPAKGPRDSTPPRQIAAHDGVSNRSGPSGQGSSASPLRGSPVHRDAGDPRAPNNLSSLRPRRLSGDSDSSGSSLQSGTLGRRRNEEAASSQRPGRRVSEGAILNARPGPKKQLDSRSQSRERAALPTRPSPGTRRRNPEERGRARMANGTGKLTAAQSPHPRARSQGQPSGEPVLLISRGKDGQHSWTRAEEPKETAGGSGRSTPRAKSPSARAHFPAGSRSPSLTNRRGSLPATKTADPSSIRVHTSTTPRQRQSAATGFREGSRETGESCASDSLGQELEQLARSFRTPLRLDPSQEQQLYRRLEEEFLANSQMMGLEEEEEEEPAESLGRLCDGPRALQTAPDPGAADSAYCSSSSSSSSLNFFTKYGLPPDPKEESKRNAVAQRLWGSETGPAHPNGSADPADFWDRTTRWRKPALSSSSDESNFPEVQERAVMAEPPGDALWGDGRPSASDGDPRSRTIDGDDALGHSPDEEVVLRPKSSLKKPDRVPSIYKLKLRPQIKPRTDSQPDKTPSKIPTPLSYKTAAGSGRLATGGSSPNPPRCPSSDHRPWTSFQNVFSSFAEPSRGPADSGVADEGSWA